MHSIVKKRMNMGVTLYSCEGIVDGDKSYASPSTIYGYLVAKEVIVVNREGRSVTSNTTLYLDGDDWQKIKDTDEIEFITIGRREILKINYYPSLIPDKYELLEVLL